MISWLLGLLFPEKCVICGALTQVRDQRICPECLSGLENWESSEKMPVRFLSERVVLWYYEGTVRESLLRFKFRNRPGYAEVYGRLLGQKLAGMTAGAELITWVPVSARRRKERGYDQAELIARAAAKTLGIPCGRTMNKIKDNPAQSGISDRNARRENVRDVYEVTDPTRIRGKRIILIDDILTTGATAGECARTLLKAGAERVTLGAVAASRGEKTITGHQTGAVPAEDETYQK